jgi:uncharacterized small protein (DUF1192 family)
MNKINGAGTAAQHDKKVAEVRLSIRFAHSQRNELSERIDELKKELERLEENGNRHRL